MGPRRNHKRVNDKHRAVAPENGTYWTLETKSKCKMHAGMDNIRQINLLFQHQACNMKKMTKTPKKNQKIKRQNQANDFGFVQGPKHLQELIKNEQTPKYKIRGNCHCPILTSHDGFSSYVIIVDAATQYIWVFPTKSKEPPLTTLWTFLAKHGSKSSKPTFI